MPVVLTIALVAVGLAGLLPLLQSSQATTIGYNIRQLERRRNDWEARIHELEAEIASLAALDRIENEAGQRLNMQAPEHTVYLTVDVASPESQPIPDRFLPLVYPICQPLDDLVMLSSVKKIDSFTWVFNQIE